jgi:SAM-dependent methyltransferase
MKTKKLVSSLERIVPKSIELSDNFNQETLNLHLTRYAFAKKFTVKGRILDIACGVGYGSAYLTEECPNIEQVIGVDLDTDAISYARENYSHPKLSFVCQDALTYRPSELFDTIISLETIEHLSDPSLFLRHLKALLKPGGTIVTSVPTTLSTDANPYHLNDFTQKSFRKLVLTSGFSEIDCLLQKQSFSPFKILGKKEERLSDLRKNLLSYYLKNPLQAVKRLQTTLRYGFSNHYLTLAVRKN